MSRFVVLLTITAFGCQALTQEDDQLALLEEADAAAIEEIRSTISSVLGAVTLSESAFVESSVLYIERTTRDSLAGPDPLGRKMGRPERFTLIINSGRCYLQRDTTGERWPLEHARCKPDGNNR